MDRNDPRRRPTLESMEGRPAPSSITPASPAPEVQHDRIDHDANDHDRRDDNDRGDGHHWEPKPIIIGSGHDR
jgi:hypothetical protein